MFFETLIAGAQSLQKLKLFACFQAEKNHKNLSWRHLFVVHLHLHTFNGNVLQNFRVRAKKIFK